MALAYSVEALLWGLYLLLVMVFSAGTVGASFPSRSAALVGEAVAAALGALLLGLAVHAARRRRGLLSGRLARRPATIVGVTLILVRVPVLGGGLLFLLVAAAAGFTA